MIDYVVGVDPSLTGTGLAAIWRNGGIRTARFGREGHHNESLAERYDRVITLTQQVRDWLPKVPGVLVLIEGPAYAAKDGSAHDRSHLWWRLAAIAINRELPLAVVAPMTRAKYMTGNGRAKKPAVAAAVQRHMLLDLGSYDEYDAAAIARMGAHRLGWVDGSPQQRETLAAVQWPETVSVLAGTR